MSNNLFDNEKSKYEDIVIPNELDFIVKSTLKKGRRNKTNKYLYKIAGTVAATFLFFVVLVNISPQAAHAFSSVPGLDKLVKLVTFDKGFDNSVEDGLIQDINFEENKDGVKLNVTTAVGDWKRLWIGYNLDGIEGYEVNPQIIDINSEAVGGISVGKDGIVEIEFKEFTPEFTLKLEVYNLEDDNGIRIKESLITTFEVPIKLEEDIFNTPMRQVEIENDILESDIGDIKIKEFKSSKTRIVMKFELESNDFEIMQFQNPKLVDDKGIEYELPGWYTSVPEDGIYSVEFAGEIKSDVNKLTFECDGVYYARKDDRDIKINVKEGIVGENNYGFKFESFEENKLTLTSKEVESATFDINVDSDNLISMGVASYDGVEARVHFNFKDININDIDAKIQWVLKDKTDPCRVELNIKK